MKTTSIYFSKKILFILLLAITMPTLTSAQWSAPVNLSPNAFYAMLNESMGSCFGVSNDTIHVVWQDKLTAKKSILYYTRSIDTGLVWSTPIAITSMTGNSWHPAMAVNGPNVHVAWEEIDTITNARNSYYKHSLDGGNTWSSGVFIDSTGDWPGIAVSGKNVYIVNDRHITASNSEIFFLRSLNNGLTWSPEQQLTFAADRSEDEAIVAQGSHIHMSWNDKRTGKFQIFYKESADYGVTWGPDVVVDIQSDYNTALSVDGANVDVIAAGNPVPLGRFQVLWSNSADTGATWAGATGVNLSNDTAHTYFLPHIARDGSNLHVVSSSNAGAKYFHSSTAGVTWDTPYTLPGANFVTYTGCVVHIIYTDATHKIYYLRNPTGNSGNTCVHSMGINQVTGKANQVAVYPNPSSNNITIKSETELGLMTIYNSLGEIIYKEKTNSTQQQIDISKQAAGIYFLQAQNTYIKIIKE